MARKKLLSAGMVLSAGFSLTGCMQPESHIIQDVVQSNSSFTLSEITDQAISRAYVICGYSNTQKLVELGFDPDDLYSIDRNPYAWETETGIGFFYGEEESSYVEWFAPREIDACPGKIQSETEIEPHGVIEITKEIRQPNGTDIEVYVLHVPVK